MAISSNLTFMSAAEFKQQLIDDMSLQAIDAGTDAPPTAEGSEWDLLTTGCSNIASVLIANQQILDDDSNPMRATGLPLDEYRQWLQLPEVGDSPAAGQLTVTIDGTGSIPLGLGFQAPNGFVGTITSSVVGASGAVTVDGQMTTLGSGGNLPAGTQVRLVGGPPNLRCLATAPTDWVGGNEAEDDTRKQNRILSRLQSADAGWGALRDRVLASTNAVADAFVYWAPGGPGTVKVVVVSGTSTRTRQVPSASVAVVQATLDNAYPVGTWNLLVQSALDYPTNVEIAVALPTTGSHRWMAGGPIARTIVAGVTNETAFVVTDGATLGGLSVGDTIACWDPVSLSAATAKINTISGTSISTTVWSGGGGGPSISANRIWIFPACDGLDTIVNAWLDIMGTLGPAELVATTDGRYRFTRRLPLKSSVKPMQLTSIQLAKLQQLIPEATDIAYATAPAICPTPSLVSYAPNVITQAQFAIYPL